MNIHWTSKALSDLVRLHEFLAPVNQQVAARITQSLAGAPNILIHNPRIGERLEEFYPREVRKMLIQNYEMRYEIQASDIFILRFWHTRENR